MVSINSATWQRYSFVHAIFDRILRVILHSVLFYKLMKSLIADKFPVLSHYSVKLFKESLINCFINLILSHCVSVDLNLFVYSFNCVLYNIFKTVIINHV